MERREKRRAGLRFRLLVKIPLLVACEGRERGERKRIRVWLKTKE